jgi:DNA invertase Pin-like site-specific DNA recombinase
MQTSVIYARVSSAVAENRQNTERQVIDLREYADYAKLEVKAVFEEHISGAKKNEEREGLMKAIAYCKTNKIHTLLVSELSRVGRNAFEVLSTVKELKDNCINLYLQKEQFSLFDKDGKPSLFSAIMIATLSTCSELERENIKYRLNSGRAQYIRNGGKLGRKKGSVKTTEQKEVQYKEVLAYLRKGYSVRITAKLTQVSTSTVQRLKTEFSIF